jgi:hypothetical protein
MDLTFSQKVVCAVDDEHRIQIFRALEEEFRKVSIRAFPNGDTITADGINASFGSILRKDITTVTVNENKTGYTINCKTAYSPSVMFWVFVGIDIILIGTLIGFVIGIGATLGLYFYNKSLVEKSIRSVLENVSNNIE